MPEVREGDRGENTLAMSERTLLLSFSMRQGVEAMLQSYENKTAPNRMTPTYRAT